MDRRLIESDSFAKVVPEIDKKAAKEKGPGRPPYWEMIFWWTRKPLISARAFIAASLLPADFDISEFKRIIRLNEDNPHKYQPITNGRFKAYTLLDPFAGFGSIPLEAKRLGLKKVIASELLPTAYVFLKAVLEYPKYGEKLVKDVKKYGEELMKSIEKDVKELYGDYAGFVGTWEVKCPVCGNYTPLANHWWLLKLKEGKEEEEGSEEEEEVKSGSFKRLVYMEPVKEGNRLRIRVRDLNKELGLKSLKAKVTKNKVIVNGKEYKVPEGNIEPRRSYARCLHCGSVFPGKGDDWYVKKALKEWNENYEKFLNGEIGLEELRNSKARPSLLVKFKGESKNLEFEPINDEDVEKFWNAYRLLKEIDIAKIPVERIPPYASRTVPIYLWGFDKYYKLFNARQLYILTKMISKINEIKSDVESNYSDGYAEIIRTYLAIAVLNHIRHNCLLTSLESTRKFISHALAFREIIMTWNWVDILPLANIIGSLPKSLDHIIEGLEYLIKSVKNNENIDIEVFSADVVDLSLNEKVDLIVTDPPYADDVPYPELSDFYYVWLKRVIPLPYSTQWEELTPKDIAVLRDRTRFFPNGIGTYDYFRERLAMAFRRLNEVLKDDGLLVTFYNHTSPDAWTSLLYAGWLQSKFRITAVHAITTEDETRITARGTISLDKSMAIVWRKRAEGTKHVQEVRKSAIATVSDWVSKNVSSLSLDTYIEIMGKVLAEFTKYEKLIGLKGEGVNAVEDLVTNHVFPTVVQAIVEGLAKGTGARIENPYSVFYVLVKTLVPPSRTVRKLDSNTLVFLNVSGNLSREDLVKNGIINLEKDAIELVEPENARDLNEAIHSFEKLDHVRSAVTGNFNFANPVQVLHYLEYVALKYPDRLKEEIDKLREKTRFVDEALSIAKIFTKVLNKNDIEYEPSCRLVGGCKEGLERWAR